jgi:hypothetical protein
MNRLQHLQEFYLLLSELESKLLGKRVLAECSGRFAWPARGVYFFFEPGEERSDSGCGTRVVRVGTHALKPSSQSKLWQRLGQHRGRDHGGGGNHRGSIFRLLIGTALQHRPGYASVVSWGVKSGSGAAALHLGLQHSEVRDRELALECAVTRYIGAMPFLWLEVDDAPSPASNRGMLERNSIALLSNFGKEPLLDQPSSAWLGKLGDRERVRRSGLWNNSHVDEPYDPAFLASLKRFVQ